MAENEILRDAKAHLLDDAGTQALREEANGSGRTSVLKAGITQVASLITSDKGTQEEIANYTAAGLKTGALFVAGRYGLGAAAGLYALDEMNPNSSAGTMVLDGSLGAAKGIAMKALFNKVGDTNFDPAVKALGLGVGSRLTESLMTRSNYYDTKGEFNPTAGLANALSTSFDRRAIGTDAVAFGASFGMFRGADALTRGALAESKLASTMFLGGSYGAIVGAHDEVGRQIRTGGDFDAGKIGFRALLMGTVDAVAAIPGGLQTDATVRVSEQRRAADDAATALQARLARPKMEPLTEAQVAETRNAARENGLWLIETPRLELAQDGTPVVMPMRGNFDQNAAAVAKLAGELNRPVTLDWNSVRFRVEPGMNAQGVKTAWDNANSAPERIAELKRMEAERDAQARAQKATEEAAIRALQGKPAREPELMLSDVMRQSQNSGLDWGMYGMSTLKHPAEIFSFARAFTRFSPENAAANLRSAGRVAQPGTEPIWKEAADFIAKNGPGPTPPNEATLFARARKFANVKDLAAQQDLMVQKSDAQGTVVMPNGPADINSAGAQVGRFAAALNKPVLLDWNGQLVEVRPNATGAEVEKTWRAGLR